MSEPNPLMRALYRYRARRRAGLPGVEVRRLGALRRLVPVDRYFGLPRGTPVDRFYIERFLAQHGVNPGYGQGDVRGRVMEVGGSAYARAYSLASEVESIDVLHVDSSNPEATIVGDLESGDGVPAEAFDCIICTQTLHLLYDLDAAVRNLHRALRPGGVVLVTAPVITGRCNPDDVRGGDYWRLTPGSARRLFETHFPADRVQVETYGNLRSATAFLHGLAAHELADAELDLDDKAYPVIVAVRAVKGASAP